MRNPRRREREGKEEGRVGAERRRKADEGTAIMDNVLSSGVPRSWKRVTIVEDLTPLQCVVMRKHPITTLGMERERERGMEYISACIHGNDYVDTPPRHWLV